MAYPTYLLSIKGSMIYVDAFLGYNINGWRKRLRRDYGPIWLPTHIPYAIALVPLNVWHTKQALGFWRELVQSNTWNGTTLSRHTTRGSNQTQYNVP